MPLGPARLRTTKGRMNLVGSHVKELRTNLGLTQDQLCARIADHTAGAWGPTWRDIYRVEAGTRTVSDLELIVLAAGLECSVLSLIGHDFDVPAAELAAQMFKSGDEG